MCWLCGVRRAVGRAGRVVSGQWAMPAVEEAGGGLRGLGPHNPEATHAAHTWAPTTLKPCRCTHT